VPDTTYHPAAHRELRGYLAKPIGEGPWPGVVVIMDALGLSDDIRIQADLLAAAGYLAFAPDLYSGRGIRCVLATIQASQSGSGEAYEDIEAARQWFHAREDCTGKIGMIGFCMGGGFALLCAPRYDFQVSSVNYGEVPKDAVDRLAGACPIVGSFGKRDRGLHGRAERLETALTQLGVTHDVKEYPDAGHSFMNRINVGPLFAPAVKFIGVHYEHVATEDAWRRILEFFEPHLRKIGRPRTRREAGCGLCPRSPCKICCRRRGLRHRNDGVCSVFPPSSRVSGPPIRRTGNPRRWGESCGDPQEALVHPESEREPVS
jgi:carboxymethylenebutenolidase